MKTFRTLSLAILTLSIFIITSCQPQAGDAKAKYVFLFIGDGMGLSQVTSTELYLSEMNGGEFEQLAFSSFPSVGFSTTHAATRFITGSAAAGTALATGHKTSIGRISMNVSGDSALTTVAERVKDHGMKVGIISSVSIDHATPAVFYAHQPGRDMYHEIGIDLANSDIDFFGGGGFKEPVKNDVNLVDLAREKGFNYINDKESFRALQPDTSRVLFVNPELTDGAAMHYAIDQGEDYITLAEITEKAIGYLDNDNGFFMMVEGGKIDWVCHANDAGAMVHEVIDFSEAVDAAIEFYHEHPEETLIIVTADHETGGLGMGSNLMKYETDYALLGEQQLSGEAFNKVTAEWLKENKLDEEGFDAMLSLLGETFGIGGEGAPIPLSKEELSVMKDAFMELGKTQEGEYGDYTRLTYLATKLLGDHAGLGWTSSKHTGLPVPVYAIGVNSEAFSGNIDNTDIPRIIRETIE